MCRRDSLFTSALVKAMSDSGLQTRKARPAQTHSLGQGQAADATWARSQHLPACSVLSHLGLSRLHVSGSNDPENCQTRHRYFPGGPVVKNLPCNTGDAGSIPGRGSKIPHAMRQLSLRAITREPA